ncbi:MAG: family 10 glycosylhydrolase [Planctomycetes bacterium]|nr:family 10 glycosylhydrolase [Planctomycetota bacterium]
MSNRPVVLLLSLSFMVYLLSGCAAVPLKFSVKDRGEIPPPPREFRAAWVATVSNINWPSEPGLPVEQQKAEALALLDLLGDHNFNAVVFQVRPQCDAMYASALEPWSYFLTGAQSQAPDPYYDPLEFWIEQAHDRGIELHAWFNPYRAHTGSSEPSEQSIVNTHPELVYQLENGTYWMDPALKGTQDHSYDVVMDVVRRYDVDGIHFDDYFYPYREYNGGRDFPDDPSWQAYQDKGGRFARNDWRRDAVNKFISRLYKNIKKEKPYVKFSLSPFGIWRPGHPDSITGLDQYDVLYADAKLWLNKGWIDYWTPQLYWPVNQIPQSFPVLLNWWIGENKKNRHFWPGINVGRGTGECINQIMITRGMLSDSPGVVHWSIGSVNRNEAELAQALLAGPYAKKSLVPASPWLDKKPPVPPHVETTMQNDQLEINFSHPNAADVFRWVIYIKQGNNWRHEILNRSSRSYMVSDANIKEIAVAAVDRTGNESRLTHLVLNH